MSEEKCEYFYIGPPHEDKATNFSEEGDDVPKISFQSLRSESPYESQCLADWKYYPNRISVHDFSLPKFEMRLAANQGNLQQLASLLAGKHAKKKRCLRPKFEELSGVAPENAVPGDTSVNYLEPIDKTKSYAFPEMLPGVLHPVSQSQEREVRI